MAVLMEQYIPVRTLFANPTVFELLSFTFQIYYCKLSDELSRLSHIRSDFSVAMVSGSLFT